MPKKLLLIDFENVQEIADLSGIDGSFQIVVFLGNHLKYVDIDLLIKNQKLGSRLDWIKVETDKKKNALDFYIAFELGKAVEKEPQRECVIYSKDKGFDPLLSELKKDKKNCKRIENLTEIK